MKIKEDFTKDALTELAWKELIQAIKPRDIVVQVNKGKVILSGTVDSYSKKITAEQIASRVSGVQSVINKIEVRVPTVHKRSDDELTDSILNSFVKNFNEPEENFAMKIENEWLMIEGQVENAYGQKIAVKGKLCKLEETTPTAIGAKKAAHHPAIITTEELAYWEVFG